MRPYAGVDYKRTLCPLQHMYHGQPYARVDLNHMPADSTLSGSWGLGIWPHGTAEPEDSAGILEQSMGG